MRLRALLGVAVLGAGLAWAPAASAAGGCTMPTRKPGVATFYRSPHLTSARTVLYGDSISYQGWRGLAAKLPGLGVDVYWGRATTPTVDALARDVRHHVPSTVIMAIGTNDRSTPQDVLAQVRRARALLPSSTRLLWMAVYVEPTPDWVPVDAQILAVPGVEVVHWEQTNLQARGTGTSSPLLADGIHLTCAGARAWAAQLHGAVVA